MATTTLQAHVDAVANINGMTVNMTTIGGFALTSEVARTRDPGARFSRTTAAPPDIEDGTTSVEYDSAVHGPILGRLRALVGSDVEGSVGRVIRDGNGNRIGLSTYTVKLVGLAEPEGNTLGGTDKGMLEFTWAASGVV